MAIRARFLARGEKPTPEEVGLEVDGGRLKYDHHGPGYTSADPSVIEQVIEAIKQGVDFSTGVAVDHIDAENSASIAVLNGVQLPEGLIACIAKADKQGPRAIQGDPFEDTLKAFWEATVEDRPSQESLDKAIHFWMALKGQDIKALAEAFDERNAKAEAAATRIEVRGDRTCLVQSPEYGFDVGYNRADVVVMFNPDFHGIRKYSVGKVTEEVPCDLGRALQELRVAENAARQAEGLEPLGDDASWGGRTTIFGSPRGLSSLLDPDLVLEIVDSCWSA